MLESFFLAITLLSLLLFYVGAGRDKRVLVFSLLWLILSGGLAISGFFENISATPPRFILVLLGNMALVFYFYRTLKASPLNNNVLLLIHGLRLFVEIGLYQLFLQRQIPEIMTFRGWNYDIIIGVSAILLFAYSFFYKKAVNEKFLLMWNVFGLLLLSIIVITAVLSSPLPIQLLAFGQPNVAVLKFPFVFLPAYIVPVVLLSHILMMKNLLKKATSIKQLPDRASK